MSEPLFEQSCRSEKTTFLPNIAGWLIKTGVYLLLKFILNQLINKQYDKAMRSCFYLFQVSSLKRVGAVLAKVSITHGN